MVVWKGFIFTKLRSEIRESKTLAKVFKFSELLYFRK